VNQRNPFQAIRSIDYTVIFVRDMAAMRRFYEDVLGFRLTMRQYPPAVRRFSWPSRFCRPRLINALTNSGAMASRSSRHPPISPSATGRCFFATLMETC
jgi:catechol 2,3-dioxygenase-like lactoylglutathione lyase family enzyme